MQTDLPEGVVLLDGGSADPRVDNPKVPKWSGNYPIPDVGAKVSPAISYRGQLWQDAQDGVVRGYDVEHGWLFLVVDFRSPKLRRVYVAGIDLLPWHKSTPPASHNP